MNNINVSFFSLNGRYYGRLTPVVNTNVTNLRKQIALSTDESYILEIARRIIHAKISNQLVIANRYSSNVPDLMEIKNEVKRLKRKVVNAESINQLIGFEGLASKYYFQALSKVIVNDFAFNGRNRRPAVDPFNCMLNLGYALLTKEIIGEIECRGLNPYIGFIHKDKAGHPALASDLIEEWRPVIVDSVVMSMIQGHEISVDGFIFGPDGCRMKDDTLRTFISKIEKRMEINNQYLNYINGALTFREAIWHQADRMCRSVQKADPNMYFPVLIR